MSFFLDIFVNRPLYHSTTLSSWYRDRWPILGGCLLFLSLLLWRSWDNFSSPGLYAEDSIHYFNLFYGDLRPISDVLQNPNGYYNIYNNLMAWLIAKADISLQPLLYQTVSLTLCALTVMMVSFSGLVTNRWLLVLCPSFLGLAGMNHLFYYLSLTFQMYVVVVLLLVLLFWKRPLNWAGSLLFLILCSLLIWSGPYSVLVVPFVGAYCFLYRGRYWLYGALFLVTAAYTLSVSESTIMLSNLLEPSVLIWWARTLGGEVLFLGFTDLFNRDRTALMVLLYCLLFFFMRRDSDYLRTTLLFAVIIVASFAPLFLSKKIMLYQRIYPCHIMIGQFFYTIFLIYSADRVLARLGDGKKLMAPALVGLAAWFLVVDYHEHPDKYRAQVMENIPRFVAKVKELEQAGYKERGEKVLVATPGSAGSFKAAAVIGERGANGKLVDKIWVE